MAATQTTPKTGSDKRKDITPLSEENPKKHRSDSYEDLRVEWSDDFPINSSQEQQTGKSEVSEKVAPKTTDEKIDCMLALYKSLEDKINCGNLNSQNRLTELRCAHNKLVEKYEVQSSELLETKACIKELNRDLANLKLECDQNKSMMVDMITTMGMINTRVEYGEKVRIDLATEIKEKKIILSGVSETKGEKIRSTVVEKLKEVLKKSKESQEQKDYKGPKFNVNPDSFDVSKIDSTYRLGKYRKNYTRNIFVSFVRTEDRQLILRAKNTVDMQKDLKFYVNEDMTIDTRNHRAALKRISKAATEAGLTSKVSGNNLLVAGKKYGKDELDIIPNRVLRSCAQEKWVPKGLAFRGERSVFSNYFTKLFIVEGQKFLSMEQYIQFSKAIFGDDAILARKIMVTSDPSKLMALGERVELSADEFDEWLVLFQEILHKGIYAKFSQNPSLRKDLLSTGDFLLFEATTDYYAGCGANLTSKKWEDSSWEGENFTGRALVEVRDRLRLEYTDDDDCYKSDVSFASENQGSTASGEKNDYKIWCRKSRTHHHASASCYSMLRKSQPITRSRPCPPADINVTKRSHVRNSDLSDMPPLEGDEIAGYSTYMEQQSSMEPIASQV